MSAIDPFLALPPAVLFLILLIRRRPIGMRFDLNLG
jgi:hypothetical protein